MRRPTTQDIGRTLLANKGKHAQKIMQWKSPLNPGGNSASKLPFYPTTSLAAICFELTTTCKKHAIDVILEEELDLYTYIYMQQKTYSCILTLYFVGMLCDRIIWD